MPLLGKGLVSITSETYQSHIVPLIDGFCRMYRGTNDLVPPGRVQRAPLCLQGHTFTRALTRL